jgi:hypothetical protein
MPWILRPPFDLVRSGILFAIYVFFVANRNYPKSIFFYLVKDGFR